jgi:hypothetical protein
VSTETSSTIGDLATLVRSKNAGPFWLTLDVFCDTDAAYAAIAAEHVITPERIGELYDVDPALVRVFRLPNLCVVKISFPRPVTAGSARDRDVHGGQQHVPLSQLSLPR